jgi:hypothetical protein
MVLKNGDLGNALLFSAAGSSGARLRFGAAYRWNLIRNEVHDTYGWWPEITSAGDGYRSLARQELLFKQNYVPWVTGFGPSKNYEGQTWWRRTASTPSAAVPGTSNHGWGKTVDVVNVGHLNQYNPTTTRYKQFAAVAAKHGFSNSEGRSIGEPWHWTDTKNPDIAIEGETPSIPEEIDDMWTDQNEAVLNAIYGWVQQMQPIVVTAVPATLANTKDIQNTLSTDEGKTLYRILLASEQVNAKADNIARGVATIAASQGGVDEAALAKALAPLLSVGLTEAQVISAVKTAFRQGTDPR